MKNYFTYEELKDDLNIVATYELIDRFDYKPISLHGMTHINNVVRIVSEVLNLLGANDEIINTAKIAAYLHDLGMKEGKKNHAKRSVKEAKRILKHKNLSAKTKKCIFNAIKYHSEYGKQKDIVSAVLIFADKLDVDKTRLGEMGFKVDGIKECKFIEKVEYNIIGNALVVNFVTTKEFDARNFEGYYHTTKVFNSVKTFADFVGLDFQILLNNNLWVDKSDIKTK